MLSRYPPVTGSPMDDISFERHLQKITTEIKRESTRKQVLLPLMEQTYLTRREMILSEHTSISEILASYSCLKIFSMVSENVVCYL